MRVRRSRGALEAAVLRVLWDADRPLTAREVQQRVDADAGVPALTTVLTVLDRLRVKRRVDKAVSPDGSHRFAPSQSESGYTAEAMMTALLATADRNAALLRFAGRLDPRDVAMLRRALDPHDPTDESSGRPG